MYLSMLAMVHDKAQSKKILILTESAVKPVVRDRSRDLKKCQHTVCLVCTEELCLQECGDNVASKCLSAFEIIEKLSGLLKISPSNNPTNTRRDFTSLTPVLDNILV